MLSLSTHTHAHAHTHTHARTRTRKHTHAHSLVPRPSRFLVHIKYFAYNVCVRAGRSGNEATRTHTLFSLSLFASFLLPFLSMSLSISPSLPPSPTLSLSLALSLSPSPSLDPFCLPLTFLSPLLACSCPLSLHASPPSPPPPYSLFSLVNLLIVLITVNK